MSKPELSDRAYFSIRINVNKSCTVEQIKNLVKNYTNTLACFEAKDCDKEIKNDHVHLILWNEDEVDSENFAKLFVENMKLEIKGTRGNERFAVCHKKQPFLNACLYLCKGYISHEPNIIINTHFSEPEINWMWKEYWLRNRVSIDKKKEDTSLRIIPRIWERFGDERPHINNRHLSLVQEKEYYEVFTYWRLVCLQVWEEDEKPYSHDKFMEVVMALMLKSNPDKFERQTLNKHEKIAGFGNGALNRIKGLDIAEFES